MQKIKIDTIIFDFDSTVLKGELLEILAKTKLDGSPKKDKILDQIKKITNLGMEGEIPFSESLSRRLKLLQLDETTLISSEKIITDLINDEYLNLLPKIAGKQKYIISGGYKNSIDLIADRLKIPTNDIYAIDLCFDQNGLFSHFDDNNPLTQSNGKAIIANRIKDKGATLMIGDGMTDFQVKALGGANYFAAYTGVVHRKTVAQKADFVLTGLSRLMDFIE